jgi:branched-chain amino acid aminotransferase
MCAVTGNVRGPPEQRAPGATPTGRRPSERPSVSDRIVYVNGEFLPQEDAKISVFDHVVLYGDGVFETAVAWDGVVFKLEEHLDRLFRSLSAILLELPQSRAQIREIVLETIRRNKLDHAYVKLLVTRGSNDEPLLDPTGCVPGVICFARPYLYMASPEKVEQGLRVKTTAVRRPPSEVLDPHIKSLNYLNLVLAKLEAKAAAADEALLLDIRGNVCEAPGYNVFTVSEGVLSTPWQDILAGITRQTVIEIANAAAMRVREETLDLYHVHTADEVFFCSTAGGILPVIEVDGRPIGSGIPGPVYRHVHAEYETLLRSGRTGTPIRA